uniref:NADH-ubiquinone oxidoreductase chain 5 n=1 Tax=Pedipes pedipes TaxID=999235 RepID=G8HPB1_9EUPU|nr:NADH dehydrogenase subunit 5 [Pedipes pedipes]AEQ93857.1 NADH dehydrogenase subunit 5 [Pedipes pedipes]
MNENQKSKLRLPVFLLIMFLAPSMVYFNFMKEKYMILYSLKFFTVSTLPFSMELLLDSINIGFSAVVMIISLSVFCFASSYMDNDEHFNRFIWILLAFVISMCLLLFSASVFFLLLGWDGLGITSFALIVYYQSGTSLVAGFHTLLINRLGDSLIIVSLFLFTLLGQFNYLFFSEASVSLLIVLFVAAMTKSAQYPFSSWLPAAMAAPTPVSALVHSSTLVTAGIFLMIRLSNGVGFFHYTSSLLMMAGSITCLLGGWAASYENDIKKIIALSTLSQLGVMVYCLGLNLPMLALFHLYTHALFKALLFLSAGSLLMSTYGVQDVRSMAGVGLKMPSSVVLFIVSSLCLVGAPFTSAFYSKHVILEKMFENGTNCLSVMVMLLATFMTAFYVTRTMKAMVSENSKMVFVSVVRDMKVYLPMYLLGLCAIISGKFFSSVDCSMVSCTFIPATLSNTLSLTTMFGILLSLLLAVTNKSYALSTLFFLAPVYVGSSKLIYPAVKNMSNLDHGWLEPKYLFNSSVNEVSIFLSKFFGMKNVQDKFNTYSTGLGLYQALITLVVVFTCFSVV